MPPSPEPEVPLILVVPGRYDQFWGWLGATRYDQIRSANRGAGSVMLKNGTRLQCITQEMQARGYDRDTPVIRVGTWPHDRPWAHLLHERFTNITNEDW